MQKESKPELPSEAGELWTTMVASMMKSYLFRGSKASDVSNVRH